MRLNIKKVWKVFVFQLILICLFVLFARTMLTNSLDDGLDSLDPNFSSNVRFISHEFDAKKSKSEKFSRKKFRLAKNADFSDLFYTLNLSFRYASDVVQSVSIRKICFREGSVNISNKRAYENDTNAKTDDLDFVDNLLSNNSNYQVSEECECLGEWHGPNCGQPEIIWRALMTSKEKLKPVKLIDRAHNLFYIITPVSNINVETLEIQVMELIEIVNLFVFCDLIKTSEPKDLLRHQINQGFFSKIREKVLLLKDETCSARNIYRKLRKSVGAADMRPQDILVYSKSDEILSRKALTYFKWHDDWPQPVRFRLKYNIYGFFFAHPEKTTIASMACQLNILEQFYKSDPDLVLNKASFQFVIGDLNHYGGWFCEYCYQPIDIIKKLYLDNNLANNKTNSNIFQINSSVQSSENGAGGKNHVINIEYIQNLIAKGLYIDGKLELHKLRHYQESKYYTPDYVAKNRWKFDNIVTNLYASWDADLDNNDYLF